MAKRTSLQQTLIRTEENLDIVTIVNQALVDILMAKQIISEEELVNYIGKVSSEKLQVANSHS
jgi:hypothetical protein